MIKARSLGFIIIILALLTVSARYVKEELRLASLQAEEKLKAELKRQILNELKGEVKTLVKKELEIYLAENLTPSDSEHKKLTLTQATSQDMSAEQPAETTQQAIRRMIIDILQKDAQIRELTSLELESVTASAIELAAETPAGSKNIPPDLMAKNSSPSSSHSQDEDVSITAEGQKVESIERTLVQRGGMLLKRGKLQVEPSVTYAQFSSNRINIHGFSVLPVLIIGNISTDTIKRNIVINTLSLKYGLLDNLQADFKVPYRYEHSSQQNNTTGAETVKRIDGLGDAEFGISRQIGWEHGLMPDLLASFGVKTTTGKSPYESDTGTGIGTGHWSIRSALVAVKSSDPAVVFGSLSYIYSFEKYVSDSLGRIRPGETIGLSLGSAIALSYQTAINFAYEQSVSFKTKRRGRSVDGTFVNSPSFKTGFTWAVSERTSIDFSVGIGLSSDAPDVTVVLRVPHTF